MDRADDTTISLLDEIALGPARGRAPGALAIGEPREIGRDDLARLAAAGSKGVQTPALLKLRNVHHTLAKLLADGVKEGEASLITGYSISRISILKGDPAFCELLAHYQEAKKEVYLDVHQRIGSVALSMLDELQDRLETAPETFSNGELRKGATELLDRSYTRPAQAPSGPQAPQITINFKSGPGKPATQVTPEGGAERQGEFGAEDPILDLEIEAEIPPQGDG